MTSLLFIGNPPQTCGGIIQVRGGSAAIRGGIKIFRGGIISGQVSGIAGAQRNRPRGGRAGENPPGLYCRLLHGKK